MTNARFVSYTLKPETLAIDAETASPSELDAAIDDFRTCLHIEYPETENCRRAHETIPLLEEAKRKRLQIGKGEQ